MAAIFNGLVQGIQNFAIENNPELQAQRNRLRNQGNELKTGAKIMVIAAAVFTVLAIVVQLPYLLPAVVCAWQGIETHAFANRIIRLADETPLLLQISQDPNAMNEYLFSSLPLIRLTQSRCF